MNSPMRIHLKRMICLLVLAGFLSSLAGAAGPVSLQDRSVAELEERRDEIDRELSELARLTLRGGVGNMGWRSKVFADPHTRQWVEIRFEEEVRVDEIVLVPHIWRDAVTGLQGDAFPNALEIWAGSASDPQGKVIAVRTAEDQMAPRIAPLVVPVEPTRASWVRVDITELSPRASDGRFGVKLSEIFVFDREKNVALQQAVKLSSFTRTKIWAMHPRIGIVDGFTPFVIDSATGDIGHSYVGYYFDGKERSLTVDLGESLPLDQVYFHSAGQVPGIPQLLPMDHAQPPRLTVEGANRPDFSDAVPLVECERNSIYEAGPVLMRNFPETLCRYVRLTAVEPYLSPGREPGRCSLGYAEIELLSGGLNVALGKSFQLSEPVKYGDGELSRLTDGRNYYGNILPLREWLEQLGRRHDLEAERPEIEAELAIRYARHKRNLLMMYWAAGLLAAVIVLIIFVEQALHRRHVARVRQRFTANLHDELGANLHTIGLLGDTARAVKDDPDQLDNLLQRIRALTERSGIAARHCANLLEAEGLFDDVADEMRQISARVMNDLDHSIALEGEAALRQLSPRKRIDLLLFYKECLINVIRHSGATRVDTLLKADKRHIALTIADNGHGLNGEIPSSLRRRALLLGAKVTTEKPEEGGTKITLRLRSRRCLAMFTGSLS